MNKTTFENLFREYFTSLCHFAQKYIPDLDTAKEVVHDVFINIWEKRDSIDPEKSIKSYLFTAVHNRCLNHIRDQKKYNKNDSDMEYPDIAAEDASAKMQETEIELRINKAIDQLPGKCKKIFILSRYEEMPYKDIAEKQNISIKTVEAQMSKALKFMREELKDLLTIIILMMIM